MVDPAALIAEDVHEKYEALAASAKIARVYEEDPDWGHMSAVLHKKLNEHFIDINARAGTTRHYWAENSRGLLSLIAEIETDLHKLRRAGIEFQLDPRYQDALDRCRPWLSPSGGSTIPTDFEPIQIIEYEPVLIKSDKSVALKKVREAPQLVLVGSGSFGHVYSYTDPDYDTKFAVKRAKKTLSERDLARFKREFEAMKDCAFPYVVEVYTYDDDRKEYRMEFCDSTLREYVRRRNPRLTFGHRKRIALQFLYGINYLHIKGYLHRDISLQNILVKKYGPAVLVKLSDFGLVKNLQSDLTQTQTEMKGTFRDPLLGSFRDYAIVNEMYSVGRVLSYIFTGKESIPSNESAVGQIVHKCVSNNAGERYASVRELMADVEQIVAPTTEPTA